MKTNIIQFGLFLCMGAIVMMYWSRMNQELVTESESGVVPVSQLSFDEEVAKVPFETATFGMG